MSTVAQEREQETIIGVVTGTVQKNADTFQAVVKPDGSEYTKNLWTKDVPLIQSLSSQIGNRLAFLCNASYWNHPQHGQTRSLWIEQVGSPAMMPPAQPMAAQSMQAQPVQGQVVTVQPTVAPMGVMTPPAQSNDQRDVIRQGMIHRQTAAKVAAILLGYLPEDQRTLSTLITLSDRLVNYFDFGTPPKANPTVEDLINQAMPQGIVDGGEQWEGDQPAYDTDTDIPF